MALSPAGEAGRKRGRGSVTPSAQSCPPWQSAALGPGHELRPLGSSAGHTEKAVPWPGALLSVPRLQPSSASRDLTPGRRGPVCRPSPHSLSPPSSWPCTPPPQPAPLAWPPPLPPPADQLSSCPSSTPFSKLLRTPQCPRQGACSGEPPWRASRVPPGLSPAGIICVPCRWPPVRAGQGPLRGVGSGGTRNTEKPSPFAALDVGLRGRWWLGPWRMGAAHRGPRRGEGPTSTSSRAPCPHDERTAAPTYVPTPPGPCTPGTLPTHTSCPRSLEGGLPPPRARPAEAREVRPRAQPPHRPDAGDGTSPHSPSP